MRNLRTILEREPAAIGTLVASVLPVLVLAGIIDLDEQAIAAIVVAINAVVGFAVRLAVTPIARLADAEPGTSLPHHPTAAPSDPPVAAN